MILARLTCWHRPTASQRVLLLATPPGYQDWDDPTPWYALLLPSGGWTLAAGADSDGTTRVDVSTLALDARPSPNSGASRLLSLVDGCVLPGWSIELFEVAEGRPLSEARALARPTIEGVDKELYRWTLRIRAPEADLDLRAAGPGAYGGTGGTDGEAALKDKGKELLIGRHRHLEPTYLGDDPDTACHLYSVSGGRPMGGYREVRSRGRRMVDEVTTTPTAGQWRQDRETGLLWVGPGDVGTITVAADGVTASDGHVIELPGEVAAYLATEASGAFAADAVDAGATEALDAAGEPLVKWIGAGDDAGLRTVLDEIGRSAMADWYVTPSNVLTFAPGGPPSGEPTAALRAGPDFASVTPATTSVDIAPRRVKVRYAQNARVLTASEIVEDIPSDEKTSLATEWLDAVYEDPDAAAYPVDQTDSLETLHATDEGAQALAERRHAVAQDPPALYELKTGRIPTMAIGQLVSVLVPGHPVFDAAPTVRVDRVEVDLAGQMHTITVKVYHA